MLHFLLIHGKKGFVIPTKSFVKIGIPTTFCYNNKMFSSVDKTLGCCSKLFGCSNKNFICCPQFCCLNKTIFIRVRRHFIRLIEANLSDGAIANIATDNAFRLINFDRNRLISYNTVLVKNGREQKSIEELQRCLHGIKGFVIPTKSFVKIGITKIFCYNYKMFSSINKTFGCCSKMFGYSNKKNICCP